MQHAAQHHFNGRTRHWVEWVELMLREAVNCQPSVAELLSVSRHSLARALAEEGVSFRELAKDSRHERACRLLSQAKLQLVNQL